jgi:arsenate reductase
VTTLQLYGLKTCDTCRKAVKALAAAGRPVTLIDLREDSALPARLPAWLEAVGPERLINTRSTTWRSLDEATRALAHTDPVKALGAHPALIKRPVIEAGGVVHVGWTKDVQSALGL